MHILNAYQRLACAVLLALLLATLPLSSASALAPRSVNYQAYLAHADGSPINGLAEITFSAYLTADGGTPLWNQTSEVTVQQGQFSVVLGGNDHRFPEDLWDQPVYLQLMIAGEALLPRRLLSAQPYAFRADDADTLRGSRPQDLDQSAQVADLDAGLTSLSSSVDALAGSLEDVDVRLGSVEATGADITGVSVGQGLVGGASSGNALVSISNGGVTSTMIANGDVRDIDIRSGAVTNAKLADGAVTANKIAQGAVDSASIADNAINANHVNPTAELEVRGLVINDAGLAMIFPTDTFIVSNENAIRWLAPPTGAELGSVSVSAPEMVIAHGAQDHELIRSNANGVGIGGAAPQSGFDVAMGQLHVAGLSGVELEVTRRFFVLSDFSASCATMGGQGCYFGEVTVTCPADKRFISGGLEGLNPRSSTGFAYPDTNGTSGTCEAVSNSPTNAECRAVCAKID